jgi:hypothetical protein
MTQQRRLLAVALTALLGVCIPAREALGDEQGEDRSERIEALRRDLRSDEPATVARAAFEAGALPRSRATLVPSLIEALKGESRSEASRGGRVVKHLLDALIQLDAEVPVALLEAHDRAIYTRKEVLILASRCGAAAHPLLRSALQRAINDREIGIAGVAAGNLLASARDDALAALVLPYVRPTALVAVSDHDRLEGSGRMRGLVCASCARCTIPDGFPPAVWYVLSFSGPGSGRSLVAKGAVASVWHVREVAERREYFGCSTRAGDRDLTKVGLGWVATLLGIRPEELQLKPRYYKGHRWSTPAAYASFVRTVRAGIQRDAQVVLDKLLTAGLLARVDRKWLVGEPRFEINDDRNDRRVSLPQVAGIGER